MRMKREGGEEEVWWNWEKRVRIADRQFENQVICKKNSKIRLFARQFKHIYWKYLHGE